MSNLKLKSVVVALAFSGLMVAAGAQAATSFNSLVYTDGTVNAAQDASTETPFRAVTDAQGNTIYVPVLESSGFTGDDLKLKVGDMLAGVFYFDSLNGTAVGAGSSYNGFVGLYLQEVTAISNVGTASIVGNTINVADFDFGVVSNAAAWQGIFGVDLLGGYYNYGALDANTIAILTQDKDQSFDIGDFANTGATLYAEGIGNPDELWATFGFDPSRTDHFWDATQAPLIPQEIVDLWPTYAGEGIGTYGYGVDVLDNNTPFTFEDRYVNRDYHFSTTAGNLYIPNVNNNNTIEDDAKGTFIVSVPEPGSVALLGLGLLGMGVALRKRRV